MYKKGSHTRVLSFFCAKFLKFKNANFKLAKSLENFNFILYN